MTAKKREAQPIEGTRFIPISQIKNNPKNPRVIRDHKFDQLVKSIQDFPEMLTLRPIIVNADYVVIGGNQRLRAAKDAGLTEVPVIVATSLDEARQAEFMIKDNVSAGEWDFEMLANEWENDALNDFGLHVPQFDLDKDLIDDVSDLEAESTDQTATEDELRHENEDKFKHDKDERYSLFEVVISKENKTKLLETLTEIKYRHSVEKIEDALMILVDCYKKVENSNPIPELSAQN